VFVVKDVDSVTGSVQTYVTYIHFVCLLLFVQRFVDFENYSA